MLRPLLSKVLRGVGGITLAGTGAVTVYTSTEQGLGLKRELKFWSTVTPVVFDYWWHSADSSPWRKYQTYLKSLQLLPTSASSQSTTVTQNEAIDHNHDDDATQIIGFDEEDDEESDRDSSKNDKQAILKELHDRNAPRIFNIMLELGGLYIKLGQVLSVTALPVPKQYRELFRTLQSDVPGHEEFEKVIKPTLERELGKPLDQVFEDFEKVPVGSASIGQAHRAKLKQLNEEGGHDDVIVKVQYPDAIWAIPADIRCVGEFLQMCVYVGVVDESSANLSFEEFSRQFMAELEYDQERQYLDEVYQSTLDPSAPYQRRGVEVPKPYPDFCTNRVITMSYLPGDKFEEEARKQLESLGFDTSQGMRSVIRDAAKETTNSQVPEAEPTKDGTQATPAKTIRSLDSWKLKLGETAGRLIGVDTILSAVRFVRRAILWSTAVAVKTIHAASSVSPVPRAIYEWADNHEQAVSQARMLEWTNDAIDALFEVHGYQIFHQGLFNADAHPGNILIIPDETGHYRKPKLGLIDYGQCKRLNPEERKKVAKLIVSVAEGESDDVIASHFRNLGVKTKNDSTKFLGDFARLMFGPFKPEHMKHEWHKAMHKEDQVTYFPNELSMVYRTAMLLRGLAMSFQFNVSVGEKWRRYAQQAIENTSTSN